MKLKSGVQSQMALAPEAKDQARVQKAAASTTNEMPKVQEKLGQVPSEQRTQVRSTAPEQARAPMTNALQPGLGAQSPADALLLGLEARFIRHEDTATVVKDKQLARRIKKFSVEDAAKKLKQLETNYRETGRLNEALEQRIKSVREAIQKSQQ